MIINVTVDDITIDGIKANIPVFTNGQTFNDLIEDKDAIYVFPSSHIKFHQNRHIGQDFKQYVANRAFIFDSYCFGDALARSLTGKSRVTVRLSRPSAGGTPTAYVPYEDARLPEPA